ncbi:unnamed protein product [Vitrella brassicaformis CCMP3155]|uniref:Uncharacterized protein n=5 Tax=Vitrella brassicaformis TaxID=1169539 RepID=A0A0G4FPP4_VITBC|nr:unnamed protein product [Vitrella brassicaformis CCMP3155]|eukprot:CEM16427.1 unnamed protein product [Vitrella brassicaformis CCMP3155]
MRNLVSGSQGCAPSDVTARGATAQRNPLMRFAHAVMHDPLRTQQIREGYHRHPLSSGGKLASPEDVHPSAVDEFKQPQQHTPPEALDAAWNDASTYRHPPPYPLPHAHAHAPPIGLPMHQQLEGLVRAQQHGPGAVNELDFFSAYQQQQQRQMREDVGASRPSDAPAPSVQQE